MKNLSLRRRLFLSCFAVSALLFCGLYFYVKGFNENNGQVRALRAFDRAQARILSLVGARHQTVSDLTAELASPTPTSLAHAEISAAGLSYAIARSGSVAVASIPLTPEDQTALLPAFNDEPGLVTLSSGRYLVRGVTPHETGHLLLLYSLAERDRAARELLQAFLLAGLALLFLTMVLAHILAREISRPLDGLRDHVRQMATAFELELPAPKGDDMREIAESYLTVARHMQTAFEHKKLALEELETYKAELLRVNATLHRRLFQVKVLLSLWSERDESLDVKDFLSRFLEALLPGLPFEYGCVIIRPSADMGSETIFAKKVPQSAATEESSDRAAGNTLWTDIGDPELKEFLLKESEVCMQTHSVRMSTALGSTRPGHLPVPMTVLSFRLQQGEEPLGSVHFLTENTNPPVSASLNQFLLNLSAQVSAQLQIKALSFATRLDPLTRLYNRGYLNDRLREEVVRCSRKRENFSLVFLDIDHFKQVNTQYGHQGADEVLRGVASMLKEMCRGSDAVCRFAGPVLAIVLADTAASGAKIFAENVRKSVEAREFPIPNGSVKITVSLGIAEFPTDADGVEAMLAQADHALMSAKEEGRNRWKAA